MRAVLPVTLVGLCLAVAAWAAGTPKNPFRAINRRTPPARPPAAASARAPIMSAEGLEGLHQVFVDGQVVGEAKFLAAVGTDGKALKTETEARLRRLPGMKTVQDRSPSVPRLLVMVVGHTIPGYSEADPPAAAHMTLALMQPVVLTRPGPGGRPLQSVGLTYHATVFSTGKAGTMKARVKEKVAELLKGFEEDYRRANPAGR